MEQRTKVRLAAKVGCAHFYWPCWLAIKFDFDGMCLSFRMPCLVGWVFNRIGVF